MWMHVSILFIYFFSISWLPVLSYFLHLLFMLLSVSHILPFAPLCPPAPYFHSQSPHWCPIHESFIDVLWLIPSPSFSQNWLPHTLLLQLSIPWFHPSDSILLITLFCSLDSSYKWDHMVFVFHHLAYFTYHNSLQFHPCCHERQKFLLFSAA